MAALSKTHINNYFKRFASREPFVSEPIETGCEMIIVIPCHNESDLIGTLTSLLKCSSINSPFEVIIVVNQKSGNTHKRINQQNLNTISDFNQWKSNLEKDHVKFHLIEALNMPQKQAGVGLARKIGMDEALRRFQSINLDGTIVCLDADCRVSENYLIAIENQFVKSSAGLGEVHFEHPYELEPDLGLRTGIINYELFLYYYVEGLKQAGFPYAIQTIGSCMLVKASAYAKHGGMNKRKAGEDFYFLHKIIPHEEFIEINQATVYPSCRTSDRVPFGTGKAQQDWLDQERQEYLTYDPKVFKELKKLFEAIDDFYIKNVQLAIDELSGINKGFLMAHNYTSKIELIKSNCRSSDQFRKQFFIWFDGFICMKFVHFVRDNYYENIPIEEAVSKLISTDKLAPTQLLELMRKESA